LKRVKKAYTWEQGSNRLESWWWSWIINGLVVVINFLVTRSNGKLNLEIVSYYLLDFSMKKMWNKVDEYMKKMIRWWSSIFL